MSNRQIFTLFACLFLSQIIFLEKTSAQVFQGTAVKYESPTLKNQFYNYSVVNLDASEVANFVRSQNSFAQIELKLGQNDWHFDFHPSPVIGKNYRLQILGNDGARSESGAGSLLALQGREISGGAAGLVLDENYLSGSFQNENEWWFIEPLRFLDAAADENLYLIYRLQDVVPNENATCIARASANFQEKHHDEIESQQNSAAKLLACYDLEIAIASDKSMFTKYGTVAAVQAHNVTVINNVQTNYTGSFIHDLNFVINFNLVITTVDPWSNTLDAGDLLDEFTAWANPPTPGFGSTDFDLGELWTNRDFTGGTVGIAWVEALCSPFKYHCLQDFTTNAAQLRCMTSHEIGHNLGASHDNCPPGNFIMCPFVSTSNAWSGLSVIDINNVISAGLGGNCLEACSGGTPVDAEFDWSPDPACAGQTVSFDDLSTGPVTSWNWTFPSGTPATSTQQNPNVIWNTAGTYNVVLSVNGGASTISHAVIISPLPNADFNVAVDGLTITCTNNSSNATSYLWNFGDGNTSNQTNPVHTYDDAGTYTITLTATNSCGSDIYTESITTAPTVDFSASPTSGCAPLTVHFSELCSPDAIFFQWVFPGGNPNSSTFPNPTVIYGNSGFYEVTLTATNAAGESATLFLDNFINVLPEPVADFDYFVNGLTASFDNQSQNGNTFLWNFGDGATSTQFNPIHTYPDAGNYDVTLTVTGTCGSETYTDNIEIVLPPTANFTANPTNGCAPLAVQYSNQSSGNPTNFSWNFPGGTPANSTAENPTVIYNLSGNYNATLVVSNSAGSNSISQPNFIQIQTAPSPNFTASTSGATVTFSNSTTGATGFLWNFGDGETSTDANPIHIYNAEGTFTVILTATNACGAVPFSEDVTIALPPLANFTFNPNPAVGCIPLTVQFSNASTGGAVNSFSWNFPGGTPSSSTATNPMVVYNSAGLFSASLTVGNIAGSNSTTQLDIISVGLGPVANFSATTNNLTADFTNNSAAATSFLWNFGDGQTSTATNPSHNYSSDGNYTVQLTATNDCGSTIFTQILSIVTPPTAGFSFSPASGCAPLTVQFTSTSSANSQNFTWNFLGGTPATSNLQNPTVVFSTPGTFSASLTVNNSAGQNTASQSNIISVNGLPTANFSAATNGLTASFSNTSAGATTYFWDFGDGQNSTAANPNHTYFSDGNYTVQLTASNICGNTTTSQTVNISTTPTAGFTFSPASGCAPLTVQFTSTSSANSQNFTWNFPGGTPATSTLQNPTVVFSTPGTFSASLTVANSAGQNTTSQSNIISVNDAPTANFSSSINGATASFSNTSVGATSYFWTFGDGQNSTAANPNHTYLLDGNYTVQLTSTNACGSVSTFQIVNIVTPPTAGFTFLPASGCAPLTVQFTSNSSANSQNFTWNFPGGTPSTSNLQNPTVVFSTPGTFSASLTASNSAGQNTANQSNIISVNDVPTANFSSSINGATASFSNTSVGATSYFWAFGDGQNSTAANPNHTYLLDGNYTVQLTSTNGCGSTTTSQVVNIATPPTAGFTFSPASGCAPLTVQFTSNSSENSQNFEWNFPGGTPATSNLQNPTVVFSTPGTFSASLTVSNSTGQNIASQTDIILVNDKPTANFTVIQAGLGGIFTNNSKNADSYFWDFGDGNTSNELNPTHQFSAAGQFTVILIATNPCGTTQFSTQVNIVGTPPLASFSANEMKGCEPFLVQFSDQSAGNPTAWNWSFPGGSPSSSTDQNPSVTYSATGNYEVSLTATNAFGSNTLTFPNFIEVITSPSVDFEFFASNGTVNFSNQSNGADNFSWNFGDGQTSTETNPTHIYTTSGNFVVTLQAINPCGASVLQKTISIEIIGTETPIWVKNFNLFPNPAAGNFTVQMTAKPAQQIDFELFNAIGQQVLQVAAPFQNGEISQKFDLENLTAGAYFLKIQMEGEAFFVRVLKQ